MRMEHKKVTRQCCVCQEEFKSAEEYSDHIINVHPLECRTCGKTFKSKSSLIGHAKIHLQVKPHACTLCPKTFITNQKLKEHMNGHTGYAPIQCNLCDKKFKRLVAFSKNLLVASSFVLCYQKFDTNLSGVTQFTQE